MSVLLRCTASDYSLLCLQTFLSSITVLRKTLKCVNKNISNMTHISCGGQCEVEQRANANSYGLFSDNDLPQVLHETRYTYLFYNYCYIRTHHQIRQRNVVKIWLCIRMLKLVLASWYVKCVWFKFDICTPIVWIKIDIFILGTNVILVIRMVHIGHEHAIYTHEYININVVLQTCYTQCNQKMHKYIHKTFNHYITHNYIFVKIITNN